MLRTVYTPMKWKDYSINFSNINEIIVAKVVWCRCVKPFHHTTILQQTTLNIFCQKIENLYNWMIILWLKVAKGEIACFEQFLLLSPCFSKRCLPQRRQKASIWGKSYTTIISIFLAIIRYNPFLHNYVIKIFINETIIIK